MKLYLVHNIYVMFFSIETEYWYTLVVLVIFIRILFTLPGTDTLI